MVNGEELKNIFNKINIVIEENKLGKRQTRVVVYPELCVTGYTCHE